MHNNKVSYALIALGGTTIAFSLVGLGSLALTSFCSLLLITTRHNFLIGTITGAGAYILALVELAFIGLGILSIRIGNKLRHSYAR